MGVCLTGLCDWGEQVVRFGHESMEEERAGCLLVEISNGKFVVIMIIDIRGRQR